MEDKRILPLLLLLELQQLTDENHVISQAELREELMEMYDVSISRNTFKEIIESLTSPSLPEHLQVKNKSKKQFSALYKDAYFTNGELDFLLDVIYFARDLNYQQKKDLIHKLYQLTNAFYQREHKEVRLTDLKDDQGLTDYFLRYEKVQEAIHTRKKIQYRSKSGHVHAVSPLALIRSNDTVTLLSKVKDKNHVIPLALYNLNDLVILEETAESTHGLVDIPDRFNLKRFVDTHRESWSGQLYSVRIIFDSHFKGNIIRDFAPKEETFRVNKKNDTITVNIQSTKDAIVRYALENIRRMTILSPPEIVEAVKEQLQQGLEKYQ